MQGDQLYHRLTQTLGKPPVLLHGGAEDTKDYKGLAFRMIVEDIRCIISLSNSVRLPVTAKTLELVFKHTDRRLFVYLDEGDKIAKQFYKNCKDVLTANSDRTDLFFVTATPGSLFKVGSWVCREVERFLYKLDTETVSSCRRTWAA